MGRAALFFLWLLAFTACERDAYNEGTGTYSLTRADFVEMYTDGSAAALYALTDEGDSLRLASSFTAVWMQRPDTLYRALYYYNKVADGKATTVAVVRVPVLSIVPAWKLKEEHTDPVKFESVWLSANRKYLNLGLYLKSGETADDAARQTIAVMRDTLLSNADGTSTACLRLYHDQGDVPQYYSSKVYASLPCSQLDCDSVRLTINTYSGTVVRTLRIRFAD